MDRETHTQTRRHLHARRQLFLAAGWQVTFLNMSASMRMCVCVCLFMCAPVCAFKLHTFLIYFLATLLHAAILATAPSSGLRAFLNP